MLVFLLLIADRTNNIWIQKISPFILPLLCHLDLLNPISRYPLSQLILGWGMEESPPSPSNFVIFKLDTSNLVAMFIYEF